MSRVGMMLRRICLSTALALGLALVLASGCQRESEGSSRASTTSTTAPPAPEAPPAHEQGAVAAVAEEPAKTKAKAAAEDGMSCGQDKESCSGGCNQWDEAAAEVLQRELPEEAVWRKLEVSGMRCGGCERRVVAHLGKLEGVLSVEADAELGVVRVAVAPDARELTHAAAARIRKLGYRVER